MPDEKVDLLEGTIDSQARGEKTVYLGDGINDAPAIARADVGVAMGGAGADLAIDSADVVLMNDDPATLVEAIRRARKTRSIVLQNIIGSLAVKLVFLAFGAVGAVMMV